MLGDISWYSVTRSKRISVGFGQALGKIKQCAKSSSARPSGFEVFVGQRSAELVSWVREAWYSGKAFIETQTEGLALLKSRTQCEFAIIGRPGSLGYRGEYGRPNFVMQEGEDQEKPIVTKWVMKLVGKMREGQERIRKMVLRQTIDWTTTGEPFPKSGTHSAL
jgi:hypothetical protein